jgi:hypothetical protein
MVTIKKRTHKKLVGWIFLIWNVGKTIKKKNILAEGFITFLAWI